MYTSMTAINMINTFPTNIFFGHNWSSKCNFWLLLYSVLFYTCFFFDPMPSKNIYFRLKRNMFPLSKIPENALFTFSNGCSKRGQGQHGQYADFQKIKVFSTRCACNQLFLLITSQLYLYLNYKVNVDCSSVTACCDYKWHLS